MQSVFINCLPAKHDQKYQASIRKLKRTYCISQEAVSSKLTEYARFQVTNKGLNGSSLGTCLKMATRWLRSPLPHALDMQVDQIF